MPALVFRRSGEHQSKNGMDSSIRNLLITLCVLVTFVLILGGSLYFVRRQRRLRKKTGNLPSYDAATRNTNRLTIETNRDSTFVYSEKQNLIDNSSPMPLSPDNVPEIRITFPEEEDKDGRRVSGRVVVVQVGEAGVGFVRPLEQDGLPPYQQSRSGEHFTSLDLERMGGLKEVK